MTNDLHKFRIHSALSSGACEVDNRVCTATCSIWIINFNGIGNAHSLIKFNCVSLKLRPPTVVNGDGPIIIAVAATIISERASSVIVHVNRDLRYVRIYMWMYVNLYAHAQTSIAKKRP